MKRWLLLQIGRASLAAWATASLVFILSRVLTTGVEEATLGEATDLRGHFSSTSPVVRQALRQRLGLDEPVFYVSRSRDAATWHWHGLHNQYHRWLRGLLHGQLGWSYRDGQPIGPKLRAALAYTLPLAAGSAAAALLAALGLGLVLAGGPPVAPAAGWRGGLHLVLTSLQGLPVFALAIGLLFLFANPSALNILPALPPADGLSEPQPGAVAIQLVLPALTLVLATLPELTLPLAAALRHELRAHYITTARAKGVPAATVLRRHALPNALLPLLTAFAGLLPTLLAGTVLVETVFAVPGVGRLLAEAASTHDYPVVVAGVLLTAGARLLGLALADGLYAWADPRIRLAS